MIIMIKGFYRESRTGCMIFMQPVNFLYYIFFTTQQKQQLLKLKNRI